MQVARERRRQALPSLTLALLGASIAGCATIAPLSGPVRGDATPIQNGYAWPARASRATAASSLDSTEISRQNVVFVEELLLGRVPGVNVTRTERGVSVRVRGPGTFLGSGEPLFVVDGVPLPLGIAHPLVGLSPRDVAQIDVLKDATAAIYGARGANGVILIRTRNAR